MDWEQIPVRKLDGIGPQTALALEKLGIGRLGDLLRYYPADYERYEAPLPVRDAAPGRFCVVRATVDTAPSSYGFGKTRSVPSVCGTAAVPCTSVISMRLT